MSPPWESQRLRQATQLDETAQSQLERLRLALDSAQTGTWDWHIASNHVAWSDSVEKLFGLGPGELRDSFEAYFERIHPDDRDHVLATIEAALKSESNDAGIEHRIVWPDGQVRWVTGRGRVFRDELGRAVRISGVVIDVTARKAVEDALRRQEELFRSIIEDQTEMLLRWRPDGVRTFVNNAYCRAFGSTYEQFVGTSFFPELRDDDRARILGNVAKLTPQSPVATHVHRSQRPDGSPCWREWTDRALFDEQGQLVEVQSVGRDISEERRSAVELRRLNLSLRERIKELTAIHHFAAMLQTDPPIDAQLLTRLAEFLPAAWQHHEIAQACVEFDSMIARTAGWRESPWQQTARFETGDGRRGAITVAYPPDFGGHDHSDPFLAEERELLTTIADMLAAHIEHRRALDSLHVSEERFRAAMYHSPMGMAMVSFDGELLEVNPALCHGLGRSRDELVGHAFQTFAHPDDVAMQLEGQQKLLTLETDSFEAEIRYLHQDGHTRWGLLRMALGPSSEGQAPYLIVQILDTTERRRIEEQFRQAQKMEALGQLAGGIAHDFNNILTAIIMQAEMSMQLAQGRPDIRECVEDIGDSAERAANLTRQLLLFSRKQVMQHRVVDLNEVVQNLLKLLARVLREDVRLKTNLSTSRLSTRADAGMLEQVLLNLAVNARDAMPAGGELTVTTGSEVIEADAPAGIAAGRYVFLDVEDTGTGMAPDQIPHIFEPFYTTKAVGAGTGLGLATVFGIVKQHRGTVRVTSEVGRGSKFRVLLPAQVDDIEMAATVPAAEPTKTGHETVLIVEDDEAVRAVTTKILERSGYRVLVAHDGAQAMTMFTENQDRIRLVLTDMIMPGGLSGNELADKLCALQPNLRIVFTSGYTPDVAGQHLQAGPHRMFVQKPFRPRALLDAVRRCLDANAGE